MRRLAVVAFLTLAAGAGLAAPAPQVSILSLRQLPTPLPAPYDPATNAQADVAAAMAKAKASSKLLLIDLGANWCADCRILSGVMDLPEVRAFIDKHYVVVRVDIGRIDRNLDIPARYGVKDVTAVPNLLIIDRKGRLVDAGHTAATSDARYMTPQALADWLAKWTN